MQKGFLRVKVHSHISVPTQMKSSHTKESRMYKEVYF